MPLGVLSELLRAGALANDARLMREADADAPVWRIQGDPTEAALLVAAAKAGIHRAALETRLPRTHEEPFSADTRRMITIHADGGAYLACMKGAPEAVLSLCNRQRLEAGSVLLDAAGRERLLAVARSMAARALRVLAIATARSTGPAMVPGEFEFLGFAGLADPPRPEAREALARAASAGIRVVMITGDHPLTARAVAAELGLPGAQNVLEGQALDAMDEAALLRAVRETAVFARVSPAHKLRIAQAWQATGAIVAMTGDGVNDAPALRQADVGVAMGQAGTEVAKDAADIVLADDNFATIEAAVEEGRSVFSNLTKFIAWTLPTNVGEGLVILMAILLAWPLPILPVQALYINMFTSVLLGIPLVFERRDPDIMQRPPRDPRRPLMTFELFMRTGLMSLLLCAGSMTMFHLETERGMGEPVARTAAVSVIVIGEMCYLFPSRALLRPAWSVPILSNMWLWAGIAAMLAVQVAFSEWSVANALFHSAPMDMTAWMHVAAMGLGMGVIVETEKAIRRFTGRSASADSA
jgi:magnesium-transporting ATPase (P-type)